MSPEPGPVSGLADIEPVAHFRRRFGQRNGALRTMEMDIDELRARAERYRRLRRFVDDERMIEVLGEFATEFLARADEIEAQLAAATAGAETKKP